MMAGMLFPFCFGKQPHEKVKPRSGADLLEIDEAMVMGNGGTLSIYVYCANQNEDRVAGIYFILFL